MCFGDREHMTKIRQTDSFSPNRTEWLTVIHVLGVREVSTTTPATQSERKSDLVVDELDGPTSFETGAILVSF